MHDRLADQRAGGLQLLSMFAGDMFLPAALMISSFLRSTIADVAVGVDGGDVAGVQPALGVDRLGRSSPARCDSRASPCGPRTRSSPSSAADLDPLGGPRRRCRCGRGGGIGAVPQQEISDMPQSSRMGRPRAPKYSSSSAAIGAAPESQPCAPGRGRGARRSGCEHQLVGAAHSASELEVGTRALAGELGLLGADPAHPGVERPAHRPPPLLVGGGAPSPASSAAWSRSQTRGHRAPDRRPHPRGAPRRRRGDRGTVVDLQPPSPSRCSGTPSGRRCAPRAGRRSSSRRGPRAAARWWRGAGRACWRG